MTRQDSRNTREAITSRLRLRAYEYSDPAYYFVTICCENRESMFGEIVGGKVNLNAAGQMLEQIWLQVPTSFLGITLDCHVVMPNHVHLLIGIGVKADDPMDLTSLVDVIHWYKSLSTTIYIRGVKEHRWPRFSGRLWQQGYHDHIIRNEPELETFRDYIANNPVRWEEDSYRI